MLHPSLPLSPSVRDKFVGGELKVRIWVGRSPSHMRRPRRGRLFCGLAGRLSGPISRTITFSSPGDCVTLLSERFKVIAPRPRVSTIGVGIAAQVRSSAAGFEWARCSRTATHNERVAKWGSAAAHARTLLFLWSPPPPPPPYNESRRFVRQSNVNSAATVLVTVRRWTDTP